MHCGPAPLTIELRRQGKLPPRRLRQLTMEEAKRGTSGIRVYTLNHTLLIIL